MCLANILAHAVSAITASQNPVHAILLQAAQIQLDRAAEDFRQLHQERQDLIRQWDEARDAMKSRDEAIQVWCGREHVCVLCSDWVGSNSVVQAWPRRRHAYGVWLESSSCLRLAQPESCNTRGRAYINANASMQSAAWWLCACVVLVTTNCSRWQRPLLSARCCSSSGRLSWTHRHASLLVSPSLVSCQGLDSSWQVTWQVAKAAPCFSRLCPSAGCQAAFGSAGQAAC